MKYDYEKIGRLKVLGELRNKISNKANSLLAKRHTLEMMLEITEEIKGYANEIEEILKELMVMKDE